MGIMNAWVKKLPYIHARVKQENLSWLSNLGKVYSKSWTKKVLTRDSKKGSHLGLENKFSLKIQESPHSRLKKVLTQDSKINSPSKHKKGSKHFWRIEFYSRSP